MTVTVEQLIEKLKELDPNLPVYTVDSEYGAEPIELNYINVREEERVLTMRSLPKRVEI